MALVNFSLPYQSATMAPFLYPGGHTTANNLGLNAVLPGSMPSYNEQETFHNEPYTPPVKYHQHRRQTPQQRSQEIYAEHNKKNDKIIAEPTAKSLIYPQSLRVFQ